MKHSKQSKRMQDCIKECWDCRHTCQQVFFTHCLHMGGDHVAPEHATLMNDCIAACQLAADLMTRDSPVHAAACRACAEICDACAASCEELGGKEMLECAEACRSCADSCRAMAQGPAGMQRREDTAGIMA